MKHLNSKEIQQIGHSILLFIKNLCEENDIQFFLAYGTVLGAVRHEGFIPWDDDIDIYMIRAEYEKFKRVMADSTKDNNRYKLLDITIDNDYFMPLVKVVDTRTRMDWHVVKKQFPYGVWVDVYVLDNVPDDNKELNRFQNKLNFLQKCYQHSLYKTKNDSLKHFFSNAFFSWTNIFGPRFFAIQMASLSIRYNNKKTKRFAPSAFTASSRRQAVLSKDMIGDGSIVVFEGEKYLAPEKTDNYLRHFYNDYLKLPPEEKRISNHTADFYLIDENEQ